MSSDKHSDNVILMSEGWPPSVGSWPEQFSRKLAVIISCVLAICLIICPLSVPRRSIILADKEKMTQLADPISPWIRCITDAPTERRWLHLLKNERGPAIDWLIEWIELNVFETFQRLFKTVSIWIGTMLSFHDVKKILITCLYSIISS